MENQKLITILVPAYNEEDVLNMLYERVSKIMNSLSNYNFEMLFINDGSTDKTLDILKELRKNDNRICYLNLSRNYGKEIAMIAGLDYSKGDAVIIIDADLQDPPELIPEMISYWEDGYDDVYAKRKSRKGETWLKKFTSKMYYKTLQSVTKIKIQTDEVQEVRWFEVDDLVNVIKNNFDGLTGKTGCWNYLLKYLEMRKGL